MAEKQNIVVAPLATVTLEDGSVHYLTRGATLPSSTSKKQVEHLISVGVVESVKVLTVEDVEVVDLAPAGGSSSQTPAGGSDETVEVPEGDPTVDWSVKELQAWSAREGIELPKAAKTKGDILDVIAEAKATPKNES